jgi:hypothetical protein
MMLLEPRSEFDSCVVGVCYDNDKAIYDTELVLETLMRIYELNREDALDWFEYNILRSLPYHEDSPLFMNTDFELEE